MEYLFSRLQAKVVNWEEVNKVIWLETKSGTLSIKSIYFVLEPKRSVPFSIGAIWNGWVPPKASFFA